MGSEMCIRDSKNTGASWVSWTSSWADYDGDGDAAVFVANGAESKTGQASALIPQASGTFTEASGSGISASATNAISAAAADYDGDLAPDLSLVNSRFPGFEGATLYSNDTDGISGIVVAPTRINAADGVGLTVQVFEGSKLLANTVIAGGSATPEIFVATSGVGKLRIELTTSDGSTSSQTGVASGQRVSVSP